MTPSGRYPQYRAPTGDGQTLCAPPWNETSELLSSNRAQLEARSGELHGRSFLELAQAARAAVLTAAVAYTRSYADVDVAADSDQPLILTGHQPGFVHPGVWLKNFAAARLAQDAYGVAISLVIDSDLCRSTSIRVPAGGVEHPRGEQVAYDQMTAQVPYEERRIADLSTWQSFGSRTSKTIAPLVSDPLIHQWWPEAVGGGQAQGMLAPAMSQTRHQLELAWHAGSLEIPQSLVCRTAPFRWFATALLGSADRFRTAHNEALAEYRQIHRLRNHAQPVPNLAAQDGWTEAPFWIWSSDDPTRRALFVKQTSGQLLLTDRAGWQATLPWRPDGDGASAVERLAEWESHGVKLRTRALVTTMFARLLLADVFIHGVGGAKYDQVTNAICERFFGFQPPPHLTLTGTLRLPISHESVPPDKARQLQQALRNLRYHPEANLELAALAEGDRQRVSQLLEQKHTWVHTTKTADNGATRHRHIVSSNTALAAWTAPQREQLEAELSDSLRQLRANQLLESREYPFCLFPREQLRIFLLDFLSKMA